MSRRALKAAGVEIGKYGDLRIVVDGIVSRGHVREFSVRPMIELLDDDPIRDGWRQRWDRPPTESELNWWVKAEYEGTVPPDL